MMRMFLTEKPYKLISIWIAMFTLGGFWVNYYSKLPFGVSDKYFILHLHAVVFTGWLIILITQAHYAAVGKIKKHMALGRIGIYWGWALFSMGTIITFYVFERDIAEYGVERASNEMIYPFFDMLFFAPMFALAIKYRSEPAIHKRLMLVAVSVLLIAPAFRLLDALEMQSDIIRPIIWVLPLVFAQTSDLLRGRGISRIYISAIILLPLSEPIRMAVGETTAWAVFTGGLAKVIIGS